MNRRSFLKRLGTSGINKTAKTVTDVVVKKPVDSLNAIRTYDSAVKNINKNGNKVLSRKRFLDNFKKGSLKLAAKNPKETKTLIKNTGSGFVKSIGAAADPVAYAGKLSKVKVPKQFGFLENFNRFIKFISDF